MKIVIRMSALVVGLSTYHAASAQPPGGVIRIEGRIVTPTVDRGSAQAAAQTADAPHVAGEQSLANATPSGIDLLDYFVASRADLGVDAKDLRLITATYF